MNRQTEHAHSARGFEIVDGCLAPGGISLSRLAERLGGTPFLAYDRHRIDARLDLLRQHLPPEIHISYAVKANPMGALVQHLSHSVDGFDVASAGELATVLNTPMPPDRISFAGPGKDAGELRRAVAAGVTLNLESGTELERVALIGKELDVRPRVAVRINPNFELRGSGVRMGGGPAAFGLDAEKVPALLDGMRALEVDFQGFHIFAGSQNLHADRVGEAQRLAAALALDLADKAPVPPRRINIGGGFGIPYFPGEMPLDLARVGRGLAETVRSMAAALPEVRLVIELGRYIVGEAGLYVCRVLDRKESRGTVFLVTDGGLHHHLAASGNFGQVLRRNFPVAVATRMGDTRLETVSVVGRLCTPMDVLADRVRLPRAEIGDLIAIFQSGAYGLSASPTGFLGHPVPQEALV